MAAGRESYLVIRADGDTRMGTGHVMRCLALGQAWQDEGGKVALVMAPAAPALESRVQSEGMEVSRLAAVPGSLEDARQTVQLAQQCEALWIVADGYQFGFEYQRLIKASGQRLLVIDDHGHAGRYCADLVLNQNLHAHPDLYGHKELGTSLLLGPRYVLLRREFLAWRAWSREIPPRAAGILVTLGGGDPDNVTRKVLQALNRADLEPLEATVIVGGANPHLEELSNEISKFRHSVRLSRDVSNMPELMARADAAITAGGTTCWEMAFMGLPGLVVILADNQRPVAEKLAELGAAVNLGWHADLSVDRINRAAVSLVTDAAQRAQLSRTGRRLVDGDGVARVLMRLKGFRVRLRPVGSDDAPWLWEWVNDPVVRESALTNHYISWEEHIAWFQRKLSDPHCFHFMALDEADTPVGQVRFDRVEEEAEVDVSIVRDKRGQHLGSFLIDLGTKKMFTLTDIKKVIAYIKPGNVTSIKAFGKAGYQNQGKKTVRGRRVLHLTRFKAG